MIWSSFDNFRQKIIWFYYQCDLGNFWVNSNSSRQKQAKNWRRPAHWDGLGKAGVWKSGRRKESGATTTRDGFSTLLCNISHLVGQLPPGMDCCAIFLLKLGNWTLDQSSHQGWDWLPHFQWSGWGKETSVAGWDGSIKRVHTCKKVVGAGCITKFMSDIVQSLF